MSALDGLVKLFERSDAETETNIGLWKESGQLSLTDVMAGPCELSRLSLSRIAAIFWVCRDLPGNKCPGTLSRFLCTRGREVPGICRKASQPPGFQENL